MARIGPTLSDVLRERIAASGLSINAIAKASGVPQPALNWFYKSERDLTLRSAQKLVAHFDLQLQDAAEAVANSVDLDFVPKSEQEAVCAIYDYLWDVMSAMAAGVVQQAKRLALAEVGLRAAGCDAEADTCQKAMDGMARQAARIREFLDTRIKPHIGQVRRVLARAKAKATKQGRARRSSKVKAVESN